MESGIGLDRIKVTQCHRVRVLKQTHKKALTQTRLLTLIKKKKILLLPTNDGKKSYI